MTVLKINEQIAFLRKQKGMTQDELARALSVSNQAVSKWESGQCCPDIQILPDIAGLFEVSVDELLGYTSASTSRDIMLSLRKSMESLPEDKEFELAFQVAAALHTMIISRSVKTDLNHNWDTDDTIERAGRGEWDYSCLVVPEITTTMKHGSVFFSNNQNLTLKNTDVRRIAEIVKPFCNSGNLKMVFALYRLTVYSEEAFASVDQISEASGIAPEKVQNCLDGDLSPFILETDVPGNGYRLKGMYMNILPILALFDFR